MNTDRRLKLVETARRAVVCEVQGLPPEPEPEACNTDSAAEPFGGAFVTLRSGRVLRGCMGTFSPPGTVEKTVQYVARLACHDPRFEQNPIKPHELPGLNFEISILGKLRKTNDPAALRIGTDGILIRRGDATGCFLPCVAPEAGWNAEEFLSQCCRTKAHLPADAWKRDDCEVFLFTAEVISAEISPS